MNLYSLVLIIKFSGHPFNIFEANVIIALFSRSIYICLGILVSKILIVQYF
jgi:hypothetical protein